MGGHSGGGGGVDDGCLIVLSRYGGTDWYHIYSLLYCSFISASDPSFRPRTKSSRRQTAVMAMSAKQKPSLVQNINTKLRLFAAFVAKINPRATRRLMVASRLGLFETNRDNKLVSSQLTLCLMRASCSTMRLISGECCFVIMRDQIITKFERDDSCPIRTTFRLALRVK